jgi:hypothetical protein
MREALQLLSLAHTCGVQVTCRACPVVLDATRAVEITVFEGDSRRVLSVSALCGSCADNIAEDFPERMAAKGWGLEIIDGRAFTLGQHNEARSLSLL